MNMSTFTFSPNDIFDTYNSVIDGVSYNLHYLHYT